MSAKQVKPKPGAELPDLHEFTLGFFEFFGATVKPLARKKHSPVQVQLTSELATHFGRPELHLCFQQAELATGQDLVTHGSRVFDRMLTYLDQRGALTYQRLPSRFAGGEELLKAVRPVNAGIANLKMQEQIQHLYLFNWRITYRADDKREELYTVVLDESGARLPQLEDAHPSQPAVDVNQFLADAEAAPPEKNEDGQPIPARLPPMTQLLRLAESARKYAIYHADLRCVTHEAEILPRLYKSLNRLTTYYQQQIEEIHDGHDPEGEKRQLLESDLQRKIQEEVENHRLRVQVKLITYAVLQVPVASADLTLSDGKRETVVRVRRNRYTGALRRPTCHACGQETTNVALDRNGHITCDACLHQCATCQAIVCDACGVVACPTCGKENCDSCGQTCWACGERACAEHISQCPICGDQVCHHCQAECVQCGTRQCRSHLRADHVAASQGQIALICAECAVRCPGCQQYSAQVGTCNTSGQRFCNNCLATCTKCGQRFGLGFYHLIDGKPYCTSCLDVCPTCQRPAPAATPCPTCGKLTCPACGVRCSTCQQSFCAEHVHRIKACGHQFCAEDLAHCHICQSELCAVCQPVCGICEQPYCQQDSAVCLQCGCTYCRECVRRSGLCDTCAVFERESVRVDLNKEPWTMDKRVAPLIRHYNWRRLGNQRYTIYIGEAMLLGRMVIVVQEGATMPEVHSVRKVGSLETLLGRFRR